MTADWTLEDFAKEYADTLARPANGWGQHISPKLGIVSHGVMAKAQARWPDAEVQAAFQAAIREAGI